MSKLQKGNLAQTESHYHVAQTYYERALLHYPDHPQAIVGLSNILLDTYTKAIPLEPQPPGTTATNKYATQSGNGLIPHPPIVRATTNDTVPSLTISPSGSGGLTVMNKIESQSHLPASSHNPLAKEDIAQSPAQQHLNQTKTTPTLQARFSARDRAYALLSTLTKLGGGWDYAEAWLALARCYEYQEQIAKAKEVLWWCVELEESRGVRGWEVVGVGLGL
jgi:cargo-transport protein YPP1